MVLQAWAATEELSALFLFERGRDTLLTLLIFCNGWLMIFVNRGFGSLRTGIFNVAGVCTSRTRRFGVEAQFDGWCSSKILGSDSKKSSSKIARRENPQADSLGSYIEGE